MSLKTKRKNMFEECVGGVIMEGRRAAVNDKYTLGHVEFQVLVEYPNRESKRMTLSSEL